MTVTSAIPVRSPLLATPSYQPLLFVLAAVSVGILVDRYFGPLLWVWLTVAAISLAVWSRHRSSVLLLLACAACGGAWHHQWWYLFPADDLGHVATLEPQPVVIEGVVKSGPRRMLAPYPSPLRAITIGDRTRLDLWVTSLRNGTTWRPASGNTTLIVNGHLLDVAAGDCVRVFGQLLAPSPAQNPGEFDYADYCRGNRLLCLLRCESPQCVEVLSRSSRWLPQRGIDYLRTTGEMALWKYISAKNAGLASAMFLGLREELDPDQMDAFKKTGTVHLLVISGLNVGILAGCVMIALRSGWLGTRAALVLLASITLLYAVVTDAQPPVVRATVLVLVFCVAQILGRRGLGFNTLAAAALVVLVLNPVELFRPGTQLSFLAVAALIGIGQTRLLKQEPDGFNSLVLQSLTPQVRLLFVVLRFFWQLTLVSAIVWLVVQPLVAARFNLITPSAVILGPILAIPVAIAMAAGFGVMALGGLIPPLAAVCGYVCDASLAFTIAAVERARDTPGSNFPTRGPADWWLLGFYVLLALWAFVPRVRRFPIRWNAAAICSWTLVGIAASWIPTRSRQTLEMAVLSVGHGCAVVLELPGGKTLLYDAGSMASPELAARTVAGYLWWRDIPRIDALVISHADSDHYNAVPALIEQFAMREAYFSPQLFANNVDGVAVLHDAIDAAKIPVRFIAAGETILADDNCRVTVLHPPTSGVNGTDNAQSIVLLVEFAGHKILLTGDLEPPGLELLTSQTIGPVDVLLAPHHGSSRSDPPGFSRWAMAKQVVISGGVRDQSPVVRQAYEASGARVFHTATSGAVRFSITQDACAITTYR